MPDTETRLRGQWETWGGGDETLACEVLQPSIYVLCMSASQLSGKEAIKGWGEPSCSGPRHVEEEVGSREWFGQTALTLSTTLWKRKWQPQINSTFQWTISSFVTEIHRSFLCFLYSLFCPPPTQSFLPPSNHPISWTAVGLSYMKKKKSSCNYFERYLDCDMICNFSGKGHFLHLI